MAPTVRVAIAVAVTLGLSTRESLHPRPARARPARPDIVVVVTDDQHIGTLGWMPVLRNYIARRGVRFSRAMVPTSVCCPSRASILTGEYAHTTKVWENTKGWSRFRKAGMEKRTMAVWLRRAGYRTALIGKYLNAYHRANPPPGWSTWHAFLENNAKYYDYELQHTNGSTTTYGFDAASYSTDVLRRYALRFIKATPSDTPLFLYLSPAAPHEPATPAPRHLALPAPIESFWPPSARETDLSDKPRWIQDLPPVSSSSIHDARIRMYRSLRSVDGAIAAILDLQRTRRRLRNTLLIFLSDNGVMWAEHRAMGKFLPYQGATRIPMAMAWPATLSGGRVDRRLALNIDVAGTVAAAASAPHPDVAGRNLIQRWERSGFVLEAGGTEAFRGNGTNVGRPPYCGWRTRRYLFVHYGNGREELYDYARDPWELRDRRGTAPDVQRRLRRRAREACVPEPPGFNWG
jgi:N-acetylglucosamine-6-sulfatase